MSGGTRRPAKGVDGREVRWGEREEEEQEEAERERARLWGAPQRIARRCVVQ